MGTEAVGGGGIPPGLTEAREQLERVLASADFTASDRLRRFLRYVVEEFLAGRGDLIKAYSIALEVLGRDDSFDPNADPVVRIEAGRLRRALERYYLVAGRGDPILIEVPKGGYVPQITKRLTERRADVPGAGADPVPLAAEPPLGAPPRPTDARAPPSSSPAAMARRWPWLVTVGGGVTVAVMALAWVWLVPSSDGPPATRAGGGPALPVIQIRAYSAHGAETARSIAEGLIEELITQLAAHKEIEVTAEEPDARGAGATRRPDVGPADVGWYRLEGGVRQVDGELRVTSRLVDRETGMILWSRAEDADLSRVGVLATQSRMAAELASALAAPYGVVTRLEQERASAVAVGSDADAYRCTLRFYAYREAMSADQHAAVRACLTRAVERYPSFATAWAMLAWLEIDEDRFELNRSPDATPAIDRALSAARRAVGIDPDNPRAAQALMMALFFSGAQAEAVRVGEQAVAEHPHDSELLAEFGLRVALAGNIERGMALMRQGLAGNPARAGHYRGNLAVMAYLQGDYRGSLAELRQSSQQEVGMYHLFAAMSYAQLGMMEEARKAAERFMREQPELAANIDAELDRRAVGPPARARLIEGMRLAGIPVKGGALVHNEGPATPPRH